MSKVLLTINIFGHHNYMNLIFAHGWKRFLDKHKAQLDCDILFVNNGFGEDQFSQVVAPYPVFLLNRYSKFQVPFDTECTYWPIKATCNQYDYVIRADHDIFPSVETLTTLIEETKKRQFDFASASNHPRPIEHERDQLKELDNRFVPMDKRKHFRWDPWGYPTHNSDLFIIKTEFFRRVEEKYHAHPIISNRKNFRFCSFHTSTLVYHEVCNVMNYIETRYEGTGNEHLHIDGSINSDWWTMMCASKPHYVGIVGKSSGSFMYQNHILHYARAMTYPSYYEVVDDVDTSFDHKETISAPYFHLGNGYLSEWYLSGNPKQLGQPDTFIQHFHGPGFGYYAPHFIIVSMLAEQFFPAPTIKQMKSRVTSLLGPEHLKEFQEFELKVRSFYDEAMEGYL